jgi:D-alanyl-D-alanine carboxypeptidase
MAGLGCRRRNILSRLSQSHLARSHVAMFAATVIVALLPNHPAQAQIGSARYSSIIVDAASGDVLEEVNADQPRHPASLTKMMTLYLTFEALRDRRIVLDQAVPVSARAASMEPSKLGLLPGSRLSVEQAILGLVTKSANDAASALSEFLGGSEDRFAQMMTLRARALGMNNSTFSNASGLPDPDQWTTARDLAILSRHLINDFPTYYGYFSTKSFLWHRQVIFNHDNMLRSYPGADGLKTGYTEASGHNLATSAVRGGVRLVGIVLGAASNGERDLHMASLLDRGFEQMDVPTSRIPLQTAAARVMLISSAHASEVVRPAAGSRSRDLVPAWAVQVGSFRTEQVARAAAAATRRTTDAGEVRVEPANVAGKAVWRALVTGLTAADAQEACASRGHRKGSCLIIRPETRDVASR